MYVDATTDQCDVCGKKFAPGNGLHGGAGKGALFVGKDLCESCGSKEKLTNCSVCGALFREGTEVVPENDYTCSRCRKRESTAPLIG